MTIKAASRVVCDAGPVIHLDELDCLSVLNNFDPDAIFLTDDAAARLAAFTLGYRVHGTIGILLRAIRRKQRTKGEIIAILHYLPNQSTLHIRSQLLEEIIGRLEKEK